jgi:hypothetical protein
MTTLQFAGRAAPLSATGVTQFATLTRSGAREMWAVLSVETSGCGFLDDRRPKILFERHQFHALTGGRYDKTHPNISQPTAGGYGAGGAYQYTRLAEALALDPDNALKSASWGLGQVMGLNFARAGFPTAQAMVDAMVDSEDAQLAAVAKFLVANHLDTALAAHNWAGFARGYNGVDYARNNYDGQLRQFYAQLVPSRVPDLTVRAVQIGLTYSGIDPQGIDGDMGPATRAAISAFQKQAGLTVTGAIDDALLDALTSDQTTAKSPDL